MAVHAMLDAKWSALVNQWVNVQRLSIVLFFLMWRQKNVLYSVMNVGPESSERNTRSPYIRIMADVLYNVLRTRICLVQHPVFKNSNRVLVCAPCSGDMRY